MEILEKNKTILEGKCTLTFDHLTLESYFELEYNPRSIKLKIPFVRQGKFFAFGKGKIEGKLKDQTPISCSKISLSSYSKEGIYFGFLEDIIIGNEVEPNSFRTNLIGAYLGIANFEFNNFKITINQNKSSGEILDFTSKYGNVLEGNELIIALKDDEVATKDEFIEISKEICLLISLVSGNTVNYNRYDFFSDNSENQNIWRFRTVLNHHARQCLNLSDLNDALKIMLPTFNSLTPKEKKCLYTVIGYINSVTSAIYLENSILNIAQAWEILAEEFITEKIELDDNIKKLKSNIKSTIKSWKKENSITDNTEFISNRLLNSLSWEVALKKIENLAVKEKLNFEVLKLDFKKLIELRNSITHTGRFKKVGEEENSLEVMYSSVLGIHVLILSKLGYNGLILKQNGGITSLEEINKYKLD